MTDEGTLLVEIISDSIFFEYDVPVEVRDGDLQLVKGPTSERRFDHLPFGLYEVSAVLEDGRTHKKLVQITSPGEMSVKLGPAEQTQSPESTAQGDPSGFSSYERPRHTQKLDSFTDAEPGTLMALTVQLLEVQGASLVKEGRRHWIFACESELESVANALVQVGDKKIRISLPISSDRPFPNNSCVVKVEEARTGVPVNAWISKERTVANALQNMLASGYVVKAADMAKDAVDLLRDKYSDPTGAALGALILYKVGGLERWQSWLENLARDFDWLPDGKVLLAKLLYDSESTRERAWDLAIRASSQRILYSESYSLLLDLLRRWPRAYDEEARRQAVDRLADQASCIDWESICFSQTILEE
jgi:hypothetical protein